MTGEARMLRGAALAGAVAIPATTAVAFVARGRPGALAALAALMLVLANFLVSGAALVWAAKRNATLFPAIAMPSYAFRMLAVLMAVKALRGSDAIDHPTFAIAFGLGVVALLACEWRIYAKTPWLALTFSPTKETT